MKNKKIIDAWDEIVPGEEIENRMFDEIGLKLRQKQKRMIFKPSKIIATAAAMVLIVGLINIQTVIAFVGGLFFVPGAGVNNVPIIYEGLEAPIDIETEYGLLTLKFVIKATKNGKISLGLNLYSLDIRASRVREEYPLYISITADGESIVTDERIEGGGGWGSDARNFVTYDYICSDFPDINEFDLTFLGVETHISLVYQPDNFALSKENNGITFAVSKFNGVNDMLAMDVYDNSESANDYNIWGNMYHGIKMYGEDGEEIRLSGGYGGYDPNSGLNYQLLQMYKNEKQVKSMTGDMVSINYERKEQLAIEIPVPKDGETIKTNIEIPIGSHTFRITEVRREGDIIYYENNCFAVITQKSHSDKNTGSFTTQGIPYNEGQEREQAITNGESFIEHISVGHEDDWDVNKSKMGGGEIWDFDENAETLTFYFSGATVLQFGDFNVEFE